MIKFFRKIRFGLIENNKTGKYLKYAFGEIILVVIGILISLQINNWNEANKLNKEELKILTQLNEDFKENKLRLEETINLEKNVISHSKALINILQTKNTNVSSDSVINCVVKGAKSWWRTEFITGTYDAMSGSGKLNALTNDNLKRLLAQFSTEVELGFEDHNESINYLIELNKISAKLTPSFIMDDQLVQLGMTKNQEQITESINELINNEVVLGLVLSKTWLEINRLDYLFKIQDYNNDILNIIDSEIKK